MNPDTTALKDFHCPRWDELPSLPLYMDQVILVVEQAVGLFADEKEKVLTPSMVNNYVKQKLVPAPEKKRYTRPHMASLIAISVLKLVLPIGDAGRVISLTAEHFGQQQAYDRFGERLEALLAAAFAPGGGSIGPVHIEENEEGLLDAALAALAGRLWADAILKGRGAEKADD